MFLIRYVALAALVIWVGGAITVTMLMSPTREVLSDFDLVGLICGGVIIISLLVMKFVGPPPLSFPVRLAIAVVMVALGIYGIEWSPGGTMPTVIDAALGFVLLSWYARE